MLNGLKMKIVLDPHTLQRSKERGTNEGEIKDVIESGFTLPAKHGRIGKAKIYEFKQMRQEKLCATFKKRYCQKFYEK